MKVWWSLIIIERADSSGNRDTSSNDIFTTILFSWILKFIYSSILFLILRREINRNTSNYVVDLQQASTKESILK